MLREKLILLKQIPLIIKEISQNKQEKILKVHYFISGRFGHPSTYGRLKD